MYLLNNSNNPGLHQLDINKVVEWSDNNALEINTKKIEEIVLGSQSDSHRNSVVIHNDEIKQVFSFKHYGLTTVHLFSWKDHVGQRTKLQICFTHHHNSASKQILLLFLYYCYECTTVL